MQTRKAIDSFILSRKAANLKPISVSFYSTKLEKFARECPTLPTKPEPIEAFLALIQGSDETKDAYWRTLRAFFDFVSELPDDDSAKKGIRGCPGHKALAGGISLTLSNPKFLPILGTPHSCRSVVILTI